jgi:hypothetical protein
MQPVTLYGGAKMEALEHTGFWNYPQVRLGLAVMIMGLLFNYVLEEHIFVRLGTKTAYGYAGGWPNLFLPIVAFYLSVAGFILFLFGLKGRAGFNNPLTTLVISIVLTALYGAFYLGVQFIQTGADRLGECEGLNQAANSTNDLPESIIFPGRPAVGCSVERYGMFHSFYNDLSVTGVTSLGTQNHILENLSVYSRSAHTHRIHVTFWEKENWTTWHNDKNGASGGSSGPMTLIRTASVR